VERTTLAYDAFGAKAGAFVDVCVVSLCDAEHEQVR
jgi:hypothetical protein